MITTIAIETMWGKTDKATLWEIRGEQFWIPNSVYFFKPLTETLPRTGKLSVKKWFWDKNIKFTKKDLY